MRTLSFSCKKLFSIHFLFRFTSQKTLELTFLFLKITKRFVIFNFQ